MLRAESRSGQIYDVLHAASASVLSTDLDSAGLHLNLGLLVLDIEILHHGLRNLDGLGDLLHVCARRLDLLSRVCDGRLHRDLVGLVHRLGVGHRRGLIWHRLRVADGRSRLRVADGRSRLRVADGRSSRRVAVGRGRALRHSTVHRSTTD